MPTLYSMFDKETQALIRKQQQQWAKEQNQKIQKVLNNKK